MASEICVDLSKFSDDEKVESGSMRAALEPAQCGWRFFTAQSDMLDSMKKQPPDHGHMSFVYHHAVSGRRVFVHVHPLELFHRIQSRALNYFYEIITDSAPAKVYLDLEFNKPSNPGVDGEVLTDRIIELVLSELNSRMKVKLDKSVVLRLGSSSAKKFSTHVIFNTPFMFKDNLVVGELIRYITRNGQLDWLQIFKKDGTRNCFVDTGVYTRNRHFRILKSRKFGGPAQLEMEGIYPENRLEQEKLFLQTLVCHGEGPVMELPPPPLENEHPGLPHPPVLPHRKRTRPEDMSEGSGQPLEVDEFFENLLKGTGLQRVIRFERRAAVIYSSRPGGVCSNKGAAHQRHRIMWVLAQKLGTVHQRCGDDSDCHRYRSPRFVLPPHLISLVRPPADDFERAFALGADLPEHRLPLSALKRKLTSEPKVEKTDPQLD